MLGEQLNERVQKIVDSMSIEQKVGQMTQAERLFCTPEQAKEFHLGSILSGGGSCPGDNQVSDWIEMADEYYQASCDSIPLIYGVDAIHGNNNVLGATIFPHNIGLGAASDPELLNRIAQATAKEVLATGVEWTFAPTLAVAHDIRWGRTYESYSQDANHVESYAAPFVNGLQNNALEDSVLACVKHWVGDGGTTRGMDQGETTISYRELEETHMSPYYPALEAGVMSVMVSFNSWNGDKCHGHQFLIEDELKGRLGFDGFVVSDFDGIDYLSSDYYEAVGIAVNAGIDMFMVPEVWQEFIRCLVQHVEQGTVPMSRIDDAVSRIVSVKIRMGMFEQGKPSSRKWANHDSFGASEHRDLAREAVRKSMVLLKNREQILPLNKDQKVLITGKNADNIGHQCGGFTVAWQGVDGNDDFPGGTSIRQGIEALSDNATFISEHELSQTNLDDFDVAVAVIGERPYAEGMGDIRASDKDIIEAGSQIKGLMKVLQAYGHSTELSKLHPEDIQLLSHLVDAGKPVVTVLLSGRPLVCQKELELSDAFVAAWLPGSEGGGVAEVLFGEQDFQGKLSFAWPSEEIVGTAPSIRQETHFSMGYGLRYS